MQGWTYGLNEDTEKKRSPHLVQYSDVDDAIKVANRNAASETVRTLMVYGYVLVSPLRNKCLLLKKGRENVFQIFFC